MDQVLDSSMRLSFGYLRSPGFNVILGGLNNLKKFHQHWIDLQILNTNLFLQLFHDPWKLQFFYSHTHLPTLKFILFKQITIKANVDLDKVSIKFITFLEEDWRPFWHNLLVSQTRQEIQSHATW